MRERSSPVSVLTAESFERYSISDFRFYETSLEFEFLRPFILHLPFFSPPKKHLAWFSPSLTLMSDNDSQT